jgi:hypothetical protein
MAIVVFGLTQIFARSPEFVERFYSQGFYPRLAGFVSFFSKWIPFSLDDLFYIMLILSAILITVLLIFKKITIKKSGKIVLNILASVYVLFYLFWGFNYFRNDLNARLEIEAQQANSEEFISIFSSLVEKTNNSHTSFENFDKHRIDSLIESSYANLAPVLQLNYPAGKRKAKNITFSGFFAKAGISGYYGPFFNEVQLNKNNLPLEYPFVLAHEKAHQFGITSEAEANFYAWLVCSRSRSQQLQYSANLTILRYFMNQGFRLEGYPEIIQKLDEKVRVDYREIRQHWIGLRHEKVDKVAAKVNDTYLKTNRVEKGINDYQGVVKFVMDFSLDTAFQEQWNLISE